MGHGSVRRVGPDGGAAIEAMVGAAGASATFSDHPGPRLSPSVSLLVTKVNP